MKSVTEIIIKTDNGINVFNDFDQLRQVLNDIDYPTLKEYNEQMRSKLELIYQESYRKRLLYPCMDNFEKVVGSETKINFIKEAVASHFIFNTHTRSKHLARGYLFAGRTNYKDFKALYNLKNPFEAIKLPKIQQSGIETIPDEDFILIVAQIENPMIKDIITVLRYTGCRRNELLNLRLSNVDLANNVITIGDESFQTKTKKTRHIPLTKTVKEIIENRISGLKSLDDYVFHNPSGFVYSGDYVTHLWIQAVKVSGVKKQYKLKSLRSTFGSQILQAGNPIEVTAALLGNSVEVASLHYAKLRIENLKKAIESIEN
jgi:integrase